MANLAPSAVTSCVESSTDTDDSPVETSEIISPTSDGQRSSRSAASWIEYSGCTGQCASMAMAWPSPLEKAASALHGEAPGVAGAGISRNFQASLGRPK